MNNKIVKKLSTTDKISKLFDEYLETLPDATGIRRNDSYKVAAEREFKMFLEWLKKRTVVSQPQSNVLREAVKE
jgi:hypothetical protein